MKLTKSNIIILLLNIILLPLLGNEDLNSFLHIKVLVNILNYGLPLILIVSLLVTLIKNKVKIKLDIHLVSIIIFLISLIISLIFAVTYQGYTFTNLFKFIYMSLIILLLNYFDLDNKYISRGIIYLTIFVSIFGICQYLFNFHLSLNGIEKYTGSIGRIKSTFLIATILDKYYAYSIIYILYLLFNKKDNKYLLIICYILSIIGLGLTYSRSGLLISLFTIFIFIIYSILNKKLLFLLLIPLTTIILLFIPGEKYVFKSVYNVIENKVYKALNIEVKENESPLDQVESGNDYSVISRESYMDVAKKVIINRPITGIGIGNYTYIYVNQNVNNYLKNDVIDYHYLYPHNMYYQLGAETGIIGLISFMVLVIYNLVKKNNIFAYLLLFAILASSITESIFYVKDIAYITIILMSTVTNKKKI